MAVSPAREIALCVFLAVAICRATAPVSEISEPGSATPVTPALQKSSAKAPVDQLIPWLLDEDRQLRGIAFSEVIFDATGKKVLAFDPKNEVDRRVLKQISAACDETMKRLNAPDSVIQAIPRINEVSSHFEDALRDLLNSTTGLNCDFPRTADGKVQRSGYPDLRIVDLASKRVFYLDPKLFTDRESREQFPHFLFRTQEWRRTKCAMTRCISSAGFEHEPREKMAAGNSRAGTLSILRSSK